MKIVDYTNDQSENHINHIIEIVKRNPTVEMEEVYTERQFGDILDHDVIYVFYVGELDQNILNEWLKDNGYVKDKFYYNN